MIFFESRDCSKSKPPLSSVRICSRNEDCGSYAAVQSWEKSLRQALHEAGKKLGLKKVSPKRPARRRKRESGEGVSGRDRVESNQVESCVW